MPERALHASQVCCLLSVFPAFWRRKQGDGCEFEASLYCAVKASVLNQSGQQGETLTPQPKAQSESKSDNATSCQQWSTVIDAENLNQQHSVVANSFRDCQHQESLL